MMGDTGRSDRMRRRRGKTEIRAEGTKRGQLKWDRWEILAVFGSILLLLYIWICYENFHFHVTHLYAHLGYPNAQHMVGQRYLRGVGVGKNPEMASHWLRRAIHSALSSTSQLNQTQTSL